MRRPATTAVVPEFGKLAGELLLDPCNQMAVAVGELVQPLADELVGFGIELPEGQILQFLAQAVHAHAAGERRIDVERFLGDAGAALRRHMLQRAHIVQPVGELDQQHAHVIGDGEQKLAQVLGLLGLARDQIELLQLGQALHQMADVGAEYLVDLGAGGGCVLDGVVQQRRRNCGVVELEVGQDGRDLERVGKVRVARGPLLLAVCLHGVDIGAVEQRLVGVRVVVAHPLDQIVLPHHRGRFLRFSSSDSDLRDFSQAKRERRPAPRRVLHPWQIGLRTGHDATAAAGCWTSGFAARRLPSHRQDITAI